MKILLAHNHYIQRGGEDTAYHAEKEILQSRGHRIIEYKDHNARIREMGRIQLGLNTLFSVSSRTRLRKTLAQHRIELAHFQNIFPLISPSAYYACQDMSTPVVQTLHNFRLICPSAMLFRSGVPCESCVGRVVAWNGVLHRCYRGSTMQTAAVALMQSLHKLLDTWNSKVDIYVALTIFGKSKFVAGGLDAGKIVVKPNCIQSDPGSRPDGGRYALFVGRLSREKGLGTLLEAARKAPSVPLKIIGIGSLFNDLASAVQESRLNNIELCGFLCQNEILSFMKGARFLIFPSEWYEGFPLTLVESFACGLPVV
ncbi:MAG: glycosyltransferase, partial [Crenarchaeota archaeon]|nr:glycosyltransferase [Thermoproteota archaeon]